MYPEKKKTNFDFCVILQKMDVSRCIQMYPDVSRCIQPVFAENQTCDFCVTVVQNAPGYIGFGCIQMYPDVSSQFLIFLLFFCFSQKLTGYIQKKIHSMVKRRFSEINAVSASISYRLFLGPVLTS